MIASKWLQRIYPKYSEMYVDPSSILKCMVLKIILMCMYIHITFCVCTCLYDHHGGPVVLTLTLLFGTRFTWFSRRIQDRKQNVSRIMSVASSVGVPLDVQEPFSTFSALPPM